MIIKILKQTYLAPYWLPGFTCEWSADTNESLRRRHLVEKNWTSWRKTFHLFHPWLLKTNQCLFLTFWHSWLSQQKRSEACLHLLYFHLSCVFVLLHFSCAACDIYTNHLKPHICPGPVWAVFVLNNTWFTENFLVLTLLRLSLQDWCCFNSSWEKGLTTERGLIKSSLSLQVFHEDSIISGYRHPTSSATDCILSLFQLTNETLNIWTHFLPTWYWW